MFRGNEWRWIKIISPILVGLPIILACPTRPLEMPLPQESVVTGKIFPQTLEKDVDILFVVDNSGSMKEEQENLRQNFPKLVEALRSSTLGAEKGLAGAVCTTGNTTGCAIPNVHIGVISSDLGAGQFGTGSCATSQGDQGRLKNAPQVPGCTAPNDAYISYIDGATNVNDGNASGVESVKQALACIAELGTDGCGYEHHLEAAYWALDSNADRNPGFIRDSALLAIVIIADEDDCSARLQNLFDQNNPNLGPLNFRCFEYGTDCDGKSIDRQYRGPLDNCVPKSDEEGYLYPINRYADYFKGLKEEGRVLFTAIIGPNSPVVVTQDSDGAALQASCTSAEFGLADPGIRIKSLVDSFENEGSFTNICEGDFGPAMKALGEQIVGRLGGQCISAPLLIKGGALACKAGDSIGTNSKGEAVTCKSDCLKMADCKIQQSTGSSGSGSREWENVERCSDALFDSTSGDCGTECPCWRIAKKETCVPESVGSPYGLEILREGGKEPEKGTVANVACQTSGHKWGSKGLADLPQCQ
jgi:hypothetical protein